RHGWKPPIVIVCGELIVVLTGMPWSRAAARVKILKVEPADTPLPPPWYRSAGRLMVVLPLPGPNGLLSPIALIRPVPGSTIASAATRLPRGATVERRVLSTARCAFASRVVRIV